MGKIFDTLQEIAQKDKENGFLYIKALLHYTISKVSKNEQPRLNNYWMKIYQLRIEKGLWEQLLRNILMKAELKV
ncbi:putative transposase [Orientia tsutsugamushi str. Sido]|nr:putative transposase [Orientia tsutsugamushi str. Sido]